MTSGSDPGLKDVESQGHGKWGEFLSCTQHKIEVWCPEPPHCPGAAAFHQESHLLLHVFLPWGLYFRAVFLCGMDRMVLSQGYPVYLHLFCQRVCSREPCLQGQLPGAVATGKVGTEPGHTEGDICLPERASSTFLGSRHGINSPS